jgi:hypothetical protein
MRKSKFTEQQIALILKQDTPRDDRRPAPCRQRAPLGICGATLRSIDVRQQGNGCGEPHIVLPVGSFCVLTLAVQSAHVVLRSSRFGTTRIVPPTASASASPSGPT